MLAALARDFRPNAVKVLVLVTDEPALGPPTLHSEVGRHLGSLDAICFTIAPNYSYFREWARDHGGTWQPIGMTIDATALTQLFEDVMHRAARIAHEVHTYHGGSVRRYLERATSPSSPAGPMPAGGPARILTRTSSPSRPDVSPEPERRRLTRSVDRAISPANDRPVQRRLGPGRQA